MATLDTVDMTELVTGPARANGRRSASMDDFEQAIRELGRKWGVAGRVTLAEGDDPIEIIYAIRAAGVVNRLDVKIARRENTIFFYTNGPQPEEFVRQYNMRTSNAPS